MVLKRERCSAALIAAAVASLTSLPVQAQNDDGFGSFGGSATLASDYVFRGISNSNEEPQVKVDFLWFHPTGAYAGIWASNTAFGDTMELDPYIGYASSIGDTGLSYDVGYFQYTFPGTAADTDYGELYAIGTWSSGDFSLSPSIWHADDYFGSGDSATASQVEGSWTSGDLAVSATVGQQTWDTADDLEYTYYDVGVTQTLGDWDLDLRWHDTDDDAEDFVADPDLTDSRVVFSVTRNF